MRDVAVGNHGEPVVLDRDEHAAGGGVPDRVIGPSMAERQLEGRVAEREPGVASVSAPVLRDGALLGALCVSGPTSRLGSSPGRRLAPLVIAAAQELAALAAGGGAPAR